MASLFVIRGRDQGRHFSLETGRHGLGRDAANAIQLMDSEISRNHAVIEARDDGFELIDLESSNGTYVNGHQIRTHRLRTGDRLQLGRTLMIFTGVDRPASLEAEHGVDIVAQAQEASQIVSRFPGPDTKVVSPSASDRAAGRDLEVLYHTSLAVGRTLDIPELLGRILDLIFDRVEADRGCIMLLDPETGELEPSARRDRRGDKALDRMTISRTILDYVIQRREGVRTTDAGEDRRWDAGASIVQMGIREALCVPLQGRYGVVGAIYVDTYTSAGNYISDGRGGRFSDDHLRLMTAIAHQAALAIEDTHYYSAMVQSERLAAIGQTIATLSHHIKNILQGIRGGSYLIETGLEREDANAVRRGWRIVDKNQEKISNLVLDMLTFSKERQPDMVRTDLNAVATDVVELMQTRAAEAGVRLQLELAGALPEATFDPDAMHRAILNLVTNALDAVEPQEDRWVAVRTGYSVEEGWWLEVEDNGPGIQPEDQARVFSLFESRKGARGTGLGLPVSRKILREHGGDIYLFSQPGRGARFRLVLPPEPVREEGLSRIETMH